MYAHSALLTSTASIYVSCHVKTLNIILCEVFFYIIYICISVNIQCNNITRKGSLTLFKNFCSSSASLVEFYMLLH